MSICRWSDEHFGCDIYAYQSDEGYQVHVKSRRRIGPLALHPLERSYRENRILNAAEWTEAYRMWDESMESASHVPIGLPCDGASYSLPDLEELDAKMRELRAMGYVFPDWVLADIAEEMAEEKGQDHASD